MALDGHSDAPSISQRELAEVLKDVQALKKLFRDLALVYVIIRDVGFIGCGIRPVHTE